MVIRKVRDEDLEEIVRITNRFPDNVTVRTVEEFERLMPEFSHFFVVYRHQSKELIGYVAVFDEFSNYSSPWFDWFKNRESEKTDKLVYIDQIVVDSEFQRRGVATKLYQWLFEKLRGHYSKVCVAIFDEDKNIPSLKLHNKFGFKRIGELLTEGKVSGMYELNLNYT